MLFCQGPWCNTSMSQQNKKHSQIFPHQNKCIYITEEVHLFSVMLFGHPRLTFTTDSLIFFAVWRQWNLFLDKQICRGVKLSKIWSNTASVDSVTHSCKCKLKGWTGSTNTKRDNELWQKFTPPFSSFPSLCVERMFGAPSAEGMSVFQIVPLERLWVKYMYLHGI